MNFSRRLFVLIICTRIVMDEVTCESVASISTPHPTPPLNLRPLPSPTAPPAEPDCRSIMASLATVNFPAAQIVAVGLLGNWQLSAGPIRPGHLVYFITAPGQMIGRRFNCLLARIFFLSFHPSESPALISARAFKWGLEWRVLQFHQARRDDQKKKKEKLKGCFLWKSLEDLQGKKNKNKVQSSWFLCGV